MIRIAVNKPHDLAALHDQLLEAGVDPLRIEGEPDGSAAWIVLDDGTSPEQLAAVDAVVATHDATACQAEREAAALNEQAIRDRLETSLEQLRAGLDAIQAGTIFATATTTERALLRLLARSSLGLVRLELRKLDSSE